MLKYEGVNRFYGIRARWWGTPLNIALWFAFLTGQAYYLYLVDDIYARTVNVNLFLVFLMVRILILPFMKVRIRNNHLQWALSLSFIPLILIALLRIWMYSNLSSHGSFDQMLTQDSALRWSFVHSIVVELFMCYTFLALTGDRVEAELRLSEKKHLELSTSLQLQVDEETDRRLIQERLLAHQSRLAAMGQMIGAIGHQWRQPLSTLGMIVQRTHVLGTRGEITPQYLSEFKDSAMSRIYYMSETINAFRSFFDPEKVTEAYSPFVCIQGAVRFLEPQFKNSDTNVSVNCGGCESRRIKGYPNEFKQVILNLLGNSHDAIQARRTAAGEQGTGEIHIALHVDAENVMTIDISDNGCGLTTDIAQRLFEPYVTTKADSGGTGIGLYLSRLLVENTPGGSIRLIKSAGGATFRIEMIAEESS